MRLLAFFTWLAASCHLAAAWSYNVSSIYGPGLSSGAEVFYATDTDWSDEVTQRWTLYGAPDFYGAIKPATEQDIQHIVRVSAVYGIPFLAVGAGHGATTTLGKLHHGIEIDLSNFNSLKLNAAENLLTVGGSVVFSDLYEPLYNAGKMLPMGNAKCVGVVGAALGGTIGPYQGLFGLGLDHLESVRLVTPLGELIEASKTQNADLFWGLRGAGHNFGIVTSATFRVLDECNNGQVTSSDFLFPAAANATVWKALQSFDQDMPDELTLSIFVAYNQTSGQPLILVNGAYYGPPAEAVQYLAPFYEAGPILTGNNTVPWPKYAEVADFGSINSVDPTSCTPGQHSDGYAIGVKRTDVETLTSYFNNYTEFSAAHPEYTGLLVVYRYPNTVTLSVPDDETAYPHREIKAHVIFESYFSDSSMVDSIDQFVTAARAEFQKTSGFEGLSTYVNFAHGDEGVYSWYSERKMPRLARLKRQWDPLQLFSWYFPVPLFYPGGRW